eukprot:GFUD01007043.1.p1 GENE.GFUD01007043.1~~GFUD01007043.1.p1  ORF type:complete len:334 (+),score=100.34 GFUD01007043.1:204-1205(+)
MMVGILLAVLFSSISINVGYLTHNPSLCRDVECRPGRECITSRGRPLCVCTEHCPDHWKPVCGSDGVSYDNHCSLHKAACDSNIHITPTNQEVCSGDQEALIARQEFITQLSLWDEPSGKKIPLPDACYENDRNRLREFLMSWFLLSAKKQSWYSPGMSRGEELWGHFYSADLDRDLGMNTKEWLEYMDRNKTNTGKHHQKNNIMRQLCLAALMEEGDVDGDGKMDFAEFRRIMGDRFTPSRKVCLVSDSKHKYADGAERAVECNGCVCACGKWVCTADMCVEGYRDVETGVDDFGEDNNLDVDESEDTSDEDTGDSEENPEDDPDVQGIRWF